jgi:hypothetical protein
MITDCNRPAAAGGERRLYGSPQQRELLDGIAHWYTIRKNSGGNQNHARDIYGMKNRI